MDVLQTILYCSFVACLLLVIVLMIMGTIFTVNTKESISMLLLLALMICLAYTILYGDPLTGKKIDFTSIR
jgi:hypothetical protein